VCPDRRIPPPAPQSLDVFAQLILQRDPLVGIARRGVEPPEKRRARKQWVADDVDARDRRAWPRHDVEVEQRPVRIVPFGRHGVNGCVVVAVVLVELLQRAGNVGGAADGRRSSEAFHDGVAQEVSREAELPAEIDTLHAVERGQHVLEQNTAAGRIEGLYFDVLETPEAEQMRDRLTDGPHRQRCSGGCLDQRCQRGIHDGPSFAHEPHVGDGPADERRCGLLGVRRDGDTEDCESGEDGRAHQNLWRSRKSIANVRSPFCVRTQPSVSLWSYSRTRIWSRDAVPSARAKVM
jgi:hypothetical protein